MKKWCCLAVLALFLSGCGTESVFETLSDDPAQEAMAPEPKQIQLALPDSASLPVLQQEDGSRVYLTDDLEIRVETVPSGNLNETLRTLTGQQRRQLTLMTTKQDDLTRYDCAWAAAGETQQTARTAILDDGAYQYCLTVLWDADQTRAVEDSAAQVLSGFSVS